MEKLAPDKPVEPVLGRFRRGAQDRPIAPDRARRIHISQVRSGGCYGVPVGLIMLLRAVGSREFCQVLPPGPPGGYDFQSACPQDGGEGKKGAEGLTTNPDRDRKEKGKGT